MRRGPAAILTVLCGSGCAGEVEPASGAWVYEDEVVIDNTCGPAIPYETTEQGGFTLENPGDGTLTIDPDDGETFECTLDGRSFECPERTEEVIELTAGATAEVRVSIVGRFRSDTEAEGAQTAVLTCRDAGCQSLASLADVPDPCTIVAEFDASLAE